jgi:peptide methionine sulfoxide reductase msrA/msrB
MNKVAKTDEEGKKTLTRDEYRVLRKAGTERAFTGKYNDHYEKGVYVCAACGPPLFSSEAKYDHGSGWPSFTAAADDSHLEYQEDKSLGMSRTEVRCAVCGSHLGHLFDDGPAPTFKHFCINSVAMDFRPAAAPDIQTETATFAAGCFWGVEDKFRKVRGVLRTRVGYTGGQVHNPTYEIVCTDETGHAEAVEVIFDPSVVSYEQLLEFFFLFHDATQLNRQGPDIGTQYRSVIFYHDSKQKEAALKMIESLEKSGRFPKPIVTQVIPANEFFEAEHYHQQYLEKLRQDP